MASIRKEILIDARPEEVWDALGAWDALHERFVPGFVVDTRLNGDDRIVTFFNGVVVREVLVDLDDEARRLAWSIIDGAYTHHNGAAQSSTLVTAVRTSCGSPTCCPTIAPLSRASSWSTECGSSSRH